MIIVSCDACGSRVPKIEDSHALFVTSFDGTVVGQRWHICEWCKKELVCALSSSAKSPAASNVFDFPERGASE